MAAYYNEHDRYAAAWLRTLIQHGVIADGDVDERDIQDVSATDVRGYTQAHFFAGIGFWSLALRLAGWSDARPVWTGSCPCQPFSSAGHQRGGADDRDLWPHWARLIRECRPAVVFGEQVARAIAHGWLDRVQDDLEAVAYACGAAVLPSPSVGAFDKRERLWFVADALSTGRAEGWPESRRGSAADSGNAGDVGAADRRQQSRRGAGCDAADRGRTYGELAGSGVAGELADADGGRHDERAQDAPSSDGLADTEHAERWPVRVNRVDGRDGSHEGREETHGESGTCGEVCVVGIAASRRRAWRWHESTHVESLSASPWADVRWHLCRDGKSRPIEPRIFPLVAAGHGRDRGRVALGRAVQQAESALSPEVAAHEFNRIGTLRGAGNAINPHVAAAFIRAYRDARESEVT